MSIATKEEQLQQDEVAENLALHAALKRTRLEEDAKNPRSSFMDWIFFGVGIVALFFLRTQLVDYLWMIMLCYGIGIRSYFAAIHRRIDAIQELQELNRTIPAHGAKSPTQCK